MCTNYILMNKMMINIYVIWLVNQRILFWIIDITPFTCFFFLFFLKVENTCIRYIWSSKGHVKWLFPRFFCVFFLREEDIIFTCSKHGNRGQTKWLPCLFRIIIYLYLLYTIAQCFYIHVYSLEMNLLVYF